MASTPSILILGRGQIGAVLKALLPDAIQLGRAECDFMTMDDAAAEALLERYRPDVVLNAVAYTQVDRAEVEQVQAFQVNAAAVGSLARAAAARGVWLIHYSTDYVFDGQSPTPYEVDAPVAPLNVYGNSKAQGEALIRAAGGPHLILRTSWVYDAWGKNFLTTMLRLGKERELLSVVADQVGAPSYASHIAEATVKVMGRGIGGTVHLCNGGETSWFGFAQAIFEEARRRGEVLALKTLTAITTENYPTPAQRPKNSRLSTASFKKVFGVTLPAWQEGLKACMNERYGHPPHTT